MHGVVPYRIGTWLVSLLLVVGLIGCGAVHDMSYNSPPAAAQLSARGRAPATVVVIDTFQNPRTTLRWRDIGSGMSEAMQRALLNQGRYEVSINHALAQAVKRILSEPPDGRVEHFDALHDQYPSIRFVVTGKVTDFNHTGALAEEVRRTSLFGRRRNEAIVAIQMTVVDLERQRVVSADHLFATAPAGQKKVRDLYDDISFGSYMFWNTPLGKASEKVLAKSVARINSLSRHVPTEEYAAAGARDDRYIVRREAARKVQIGGARLNDLYAGQEFYICLPDVAEGVVPVIDPATREPLKVRVAAARAGHSGWVLGSTPPGVDLRGALLRRELPPDYDPTATGEPAPKALVEHIE